MLRRLQALDLPSAFGPADPKAAAEELPAGEHGVVATEGRNNARAAVVALERIFAGWAERAES